MLFCPDFTIKSFSRGYNVPDEENLIFSKKIQLITIIILDNIFIFNLLEQLVFH
ncbi:hypothetical protein DICPUDRAFT_148351 [Dictyostelium purpureum]|uniref:Uncharacterized protein n=1 Tax=Dictyostelium purpureum TaxID=5786 RepID=F0ZAW7_DICPU|nr:uncharacterized protein DICPUDRAFT_148351 [Dictyostelium purpureum]EGC38900.1 hypothetical protein DICPUDRAFT_148351 [Dictyostelium purpureum]|eukprot:XP_003284580.1 hypothetical protein DICPUDRAFT_148351 [Dictyostelium purpureum]